MLLIHALSFIDLLFTNYAKHALPLLDSSFKYYNSEAITNTWVIMHKIRKSGKYNNQKRYLRFSNIIKIIHQ